jgi:hypothetical protein
MTFLTALDQDVEIVIKKGSRVRNLPGPFQSLLRDDMLMARITEGNVNPTSCTRPEVGFPSLDGGPTDE